MSAVRDGDAYVVNGQKVWTSHADKSDWIFCLVRTARGGKKHEGISFLLVDMATPGVSVRPIPLISGASPFCETFFDNVRVPVGNLVGREGEGWSIAKRLLEHERSSISQNRDQRAAEEMPLEAVAKEQLGLVDGVLADPILRDRVTQSNLDVLCNKLTLQRSADHVHAGKGRGPEAAMFKLYATEMNQRRRALLVELMGAQGLGWEGEGFAATELSRTRDWLRSRANSIEGGSSEIQLNIIAKRVLNLPD
jgi:alkylation response protein AidB-like acyl-CoA dehydrogenase